MPFLYSKTCRSVPFIYAGFFASFFPQKCFFKSITKVPHFQASADDEDSENEYDSEEDDEGWVNEENFQEVVGNSEHGEVKNEKMTVACLSTDFAIQNVLLHMKLNLVSVDGMRIQKLQTYILRCR